MDIKRDFQDSKYAVVRRMAQGGSSEIWEVKTGDEQVIRDENLHQPI
jgi:hypothetical protein